MRRWLLLLLTAFVMASPAQAKGPVTVSICGVSGCEMLGTSPAHSARPGSVASALLNWSSFEPASIPPPGPFFALQLHSSRPEDEEPFLYVHDAGVLAAGRTLWLHLPRAVAARLREVTRRIEPVAEPRALEHPRYPVPPWSSERVKMEWYPAQGVLYREGEWLRVPAGLAARLGRDAGLVRPEEREPAQVPWALVGGGVAACAVAVAAGLLAAWRVSRRVGGLAR